MLNKSNWNTLKKTTAVSFLKRLLPQVHVRFVQFYNREVAVQGFEERVTVEN